MGRDALIRINILAVGKLKEKYWIDAYAEYAKRISRYAKLTLVEIPECNDTNGIATQLFKESQLILDKLTGFSILTDKDGDIINDEEFAKIFLSLPTHGTSDLTFLVGGPRGCHPDIKARVNKTISFGRLTFPHRLARIMLIEQIYRALSVNSGSPYHK